MDEICSLVLSLLLLLFLNEWNGGLQDPTSCNPKHVMQIRTSFSGFELKSVNVQPL